jgi:hypothetical protein
MDLIEGRFLNEENDEQHLINAFGGESQAHMRYLHFANQPKNKKSIMWPAYFAQSLMLNIYFMDVQHAICIIKFW